MRKTLPTLTLAALAFACFGLFALTGDPAAAAALSSLSDPRDLHWTVPAIGFGGLILNKGNLTGLYTGFKTAFQQGFNGVKPTYTKVAMVVPSTTKKEEYGWLGNFPRIREWVGERVVKSLSLHDYEIRNRKWELTVSVPREDIEDDTYGVYAPMMTEIGRAAATWPDELVWPALLNGHQALCYDEQNFFDTDHPVLDEAGNPQSVSNYQAGASPFWCLIDASRTIKPVIFQDREKFDFTRLDAPTDEPVFTRDEYVYGTKGRNNVGYGFWQLAFGSRAALNEANYAAARAAMTTFKADYGKPLGVMPNLLCVGPSNEAAARRLLTSKTINNGEDNPWVGTAELLVVPWWP